MTLISTPRLPPIFMLALLVVAGCSSTGRAVDPAKYDTMTCVELNNAVGSVAREISQTAISRGKTAQTNIPAWLLGGSRVATAVVDRDTARIDRLKQQQEAIIAVRRGKCPALPG